VRPDKYRGYSGGASGYAKAKQAGANDRVKNMPAISGDDQSTSNNSANYCSNGAKK